MKISLGFSTCPNDTFIFDAMVHHKIDTEGFDFDLLMTDIEELNHKAFSAQIDVTKLSYHAYAYVFENFQLLDCGSALGFKNGPLLISKNKLSTDDIENLAVAIPGKYTTANLLFGIQFPKVKTTKEMLFSEIEDAILKGVVDAGVIIHENRFTYEKKGLSKVIDLGEVWEQQTGYAIPLGGIVIRRDFDQETKLKIERVLRRSIEFAFANPTESSLFVKKYARELDDEVIQKHIALYVNDFSVSLGTLGKDAIKNLYQQAFQKGIIAKLPRNIFVQNF
jgi:1,4-dihydroxy-6-naphthoate synthase